jgi:hypothetical protein
VPLNSKVKANVTASEDDDEDGDDQDLDPYWYPPEEFGNERNTLLSVKGKTESSPTKLTDYQHMLCTPILRGYSLKTKKWRKSLNDTLSH